MKTAIITAVFAASLCPAAAHSAEYYYNEGSNQIFYASPLDSPSSQPILEKADTNIIKQGEAFSITLLSAFICDFHESGTFEWLSGFSNRDTTKCKGGDGYQGKNIRGEIAIIVNADEAKKDGGLSFSNSSIQSGRLVYYNQDIRETGQLINALNIPIREASIYHGLPFFFDLTILELDNKENSSSRALLSTLAEVGKTASPANAATFGLLNALGSTLINQNKDDVELRFQMRFDPPREKDSKIGRMPLREGYYLVMRQENRNPNINTDTPQKKLPPEIDPCRGVLVEAPSTPCTTLNDKPNLFYNKNTWLLFRISKENNETAKQMETIKLLNETLRDTINNTETTDTTELIKAITEFFKTQKKALEAKKNP